MVKQSEANLMPSPTTSPQLFRISPDQFVYTVGGDADPQRFLSDANFLNPFAAGFAECLGFKTIRHAIIEDAQSRTAFAYRVSPDGIGTVINGIFTREPGSPGTLLDGFKED